MSDKKVSVVVEIGAKNNVSADAKGALDDLKKVERAAEELAKKKVEIEITAKGGVALPAAASSLSSSMSSTPSASTIAATTALVTAALPRIVTQLKPTLASVATPAPPALTTSKAVAPALSLDTSAVIAATVAETVPKVQAKVASSGVGGPVSFSDEELKEFSDEIDKINGKLKVTTSKSDLRVPSLFGGDFGSVGDLQSYKRGTVDPISRPRSDDDIMAELEDTFARAEAATVTAKPVDTGLTVRESDLMFDEQDLEPYEEPKGYWGNLWDSLKSGWADAKKVIASDNPWFPGQAAVGSYFRNIGDAAKSSWANVTNNWRGAPAFPWSGSGGGGGAGGGGGGAGGSGGSGGGWAGFNSGIKEAVAGLKQFQTAALVAGAAASAAVMATAPATWATFTGSVQLLSGEFANMLIPAFTNVSFWLQQSAAWVKAWDDRTRGLVSTLAVWGGGFLLAGAAIAKLGTIIWPVVTGVIALAAAFGKATIAAMAFTVSNPWVIGLVAAVAGLALLTNGFGMLGDTISRAGSNADEARQRIERLSQPGGQGRFTREDYETLPVEIRERIERARPEDRRQIIQGELDRLAGEQQAIEGLNPYNAARTIEATLRRLNQPGAILNSRDVRADISTALQGQGWAPSIAQSAVRGLQLPQTFNGIPFSEDFIRNTSRHLGYLNALTGVVEQRSVARSVAERGVPGLFEGLTAARSPIQPRTYQSGDVFYADILQQVLGRDEMQRALIQQQMDNDARQLELLGNRIVGAINDLAMPAPR